MNGLSAANHVGLQACIRWLKLGKYIHTWQNAIKVSSSLYIKHGLKSCVRLNRWFCQLMLYYARFSRNEGNAYPSLFRSSKNRCKTGSPVVKVTHSYYYVTTCYINFCHCCQQPLSPTTCENANTIISCHWELAACPIIILSSVCCI